MISFDKKDKFVAVVSSKKVIILSLEEEMLGQIVQEYQINLNTYTDIHDIIIDSKDCTAMLFKCYIACKLAGLTNIHIFDIN